MTTIVKIDKNQSIAKLKCELPEGITGIGYSQKEKAVVFYRTQDGLFGFVGDDGSVRIVTRRLEVKNPSGICCDSWGICVLQFSNDMLWGFDQSYQSGRRLFGAGLFKSMSGFIPKNASSFAPYGICRVASDRIVMAAPWGNRLFSFSGNKEGEPIGSGSRGFSSSSSPRAAMFDSPSGVCFDDGSGLMFVSDTGNALVRVFSGSEERAFVGVPGSRGSSDGVGTMARFSAPASIRASRGLVTLVDGNLVRAFRASTLETTTTYASSRRIVDIAMGGDAVYVMEEDK